MTHNILHLHSKDRINTSSDQSGQPKFQLSQSIRLNHVRLLAASVPVSFYTNGSSTSTGLAVQLGAGGGGAAVALSVAQGIYTGTQWAAALQTALRASGVAGANGFGVAYSSSTLRLLVTFTSAFSLVVSSSAMGRLMGLEVGSTGSNAGFGIGSTKAIELAPTDIAITSSTLGAPYRPAVRSSNTLTPLFILPLDVNPGSQLVWTEGRYYQQCVHLGHHHCRDVAQLQFELRDPFGMPLDLNGLDWSITIEYDCLV